ncbi:MAG TPA: HAMP domain-containing sensor histidine kinase [Candidatus Paceibacterota bacterium]|nr:HAMP domain-containing sensor histidine kinase [Candidatus Paceibacterota bacterium]
MPLWLVFTIAFVVLIATTLGSVWYFTFTILYPLVTPEVYIPLTTGGTLLGAFVLFINLILFVILGRLIALPIRRLTRAANAFATRGERIPIVIPSFAPSEVRTLMRSFIELVGSVEAAHKKDVDTSQVKSDFITTAAHQLRTPLTGVRWALEALEKSELTEDQKALVKNATDKCHELVTIVRTLLDISAIESGKYKYAFEQVDLGALCAEVVVDFTPQATERGLVLASVPGGAIPLVRCDRERVKWIIENLVDNAIRYTPQGGHVTIGCSFGAERVFVTVHDMGIGIPAKDSANIFERFYRAGNAVAKENEGNGLGLYIARTIATDHGGDLRFSPNTDGPGTTFTLSLPVGGPATTV